MLTVAGRILMNGMANRSELALATMACEMLGSRPRPRVLIGGLGMGFTLRAALDALPKDAVVLVAELHAAVLSWCQGPIAGLTAGAVNDERVDVRLTNVSELITKSKGLDAIILDLYEGPHASAPGANQSLFDRDGLRRCRSALNRDGVLSIWGEERDPVFEKRIVTVGFSLQIERPGRGGRRHVVYLARPVTA